MFPMNSSRNQTETEAKFTMASPTLKPHQLHNFPLQDLKWTVNSANKNRFRRHSGCSSHNSSQQDGAESDGKTGCDSGKAGNSASSPFPITAKSVKETVVVAEPVVEKPEKKKLLIRLRTRSTKPDDAPAANAGDQTLPVEHGEVPIPKTWNLRPREAVTKPAAANGAASKAREPEWPDNGTQTVTGTELTPPSNAGDVKVAKKKKGKEKQKEKVRLSIQLTRQEIEEDIYALTGSKPSRKPKRRPKHVQKQLDCLFPGMWLDSVSPDSYRVPEPSIKPRI